MNVRRFGGLLILSVLCASVGACKGTPSYWSGLGLTDKGGKVVAGADDEFMVIVYPRDQAPYVDQCTRIYAPIVQAGFVEARKPLFEMSGEADQTLSKNGDSITLTCKPQGTNDLGVTFRHKNSKP